MLVLRQGRKIFIVSTVTIQIKLESQHFDCEYFTGEDGYIPEYDPYSFGNPEPLQPRTGENRSRENLGQIGDKELATQLRAVL